MLGSLMARGGFSGHPSLYRRTSTVPAMPAFFHAVEAPSTIIFGRLARGPVYRSNSAGRARVRAIAGFSFFAMGLV